MYIKASLVSILPLIHAPKVMAGFIWHPDMFPIQYAIATTDKPKANATPIVPVPAPTMSAVPPANTALPHPSNTRTIVPNSSAMYFLINIRFYRFMSINVHIFL